MILRCFYFTNLKHYTLNKHVYFLKVCHVYFGRFVFLRLNTLRVLPTRFSSSMESDADSDVAPSKRRRGGYESDNASERSEELSEENDDEEEEDDYDRSRTHGGRHRDFRDVRVSAPCINSSVIGFDFMKVRYSSPYTTIFFHLTCVVY